MGDCGGLHSPTPPGLNFRLSVKDHFHFRGGLNSLISYSPPMLHNPEQIRQSPALDLRRIWIALLAIRKGVRGTMKWSPAAPFGGGRRGENRCLNSRHKHHRQGEDQQVTHSIWRRIDKNKHDKRQPISPGDNSVRSTNPSRGKDAPNTDTKDRCACLFSGWVVETGTRQGVGDGVRVAVEM